VTIEPSSEAFVDLYRFLRWHAEPDWRLETAWSTGSALGIMPA